MYKRYLKGFTIVELSVIIAVIGIIATISIVSYVQIQKGVRNDERTTEITIMANELEKFYAKNGEYPPGCPDTSCPSVMHTANVSSAIITPNTTLDTLRGVLPGLGNDFGDPQSTSATLPLKNRTAPAAGYYYFGGTVNYTGSAATLSFGTHANFPCTIQSSLAAGTVGSYVLGYFDEITNTWILKGGRNGTPMTVTAGTCVIVRG